MPKYPCEVKAYRMDWEDRDFYVGSTRHPRISTRMAQHRSDCRNGRASTSKIGTKIREMGLHSFQYVMLGSKIINNYEEQRQYEQGWINELNPNLNSNRAYRSLEDKKKDSILSGQKWHEIPGNKERHKIMMKKWREITKKTWLCEVCDRYYASSGNLSNHKKTKKHLARV